MKKILGMAMIAGSILTLASCGSSNQQSFNGIFTDDDGDYYCILDGENLIEIKDTNHTYVWLDVDYMSQSEYKKYYEENSGREDKSDYMKYYRAYLIEAFTVDDVKYFYSAANVTILGDYSFYTSDYYNTDYNKKYYTLDGKLLQGTTSAGTVSFYLRTDEATLKTGE